jgi:hypothetical protein
VIVPRRRLNREGWSRGDITPLVLVRVAVSDESEHPCGIFKAAALIAANVVTDGARLNIDVVPRRRVTNRYLDYVFDIMNLKPARDDALVIERTDPAQLKTALWTSAIDHLSYMGADDLDKLANGWLVDLRVHDVIFPPSL